MTLTENQSSWLDTLIERGGWQWGSGFLYDNRSGTVRICEALVKKGVVVKKHLTDSEYSYKPDYDHPFVVERIALKKAEEKEWERARKERRAADHEEWRQREARAVATRALIAAHADEFQGLVVDALTTID